MRTLCTILGFVLLACGSDANRAAPETLARQTPLQPPFKVTVLSKTGGRVDWLWRGDIIAYDRMGDDGYYDIHRIRPSGEELGCLTCDIPGLPQRDVGQPAWHPTGEWLVFQAEKDIHARVRLRNATSPGGGTYNDLWVLDMATMKASLLYEVAATDPAGTLHAHFSADGKMLSWSERYGESSLRRGHELGLWKLVIAEFVADPSPHLENVRSFVPGAEGFYENHGFSPDGNVLLFTSNFVPRRPAYQNNIYRYALATSDTTALTSVPYNEHASYSPDGRTIAWMTDNDVPRQPDGLTGGSEWWLMNADGSGKTRLTYFNQVTYSPSPGKLFAASDLSWGPDGKRFAGYASAASSSIELLMPGQEEEWLVLVDVVP